MEQYGLTPQGPNPKRLDVILNEMHEQISLRTGVNTRQNPQSLLNHLLTNIADRIAELWEFGCDVYYSQYPSSAEGVSLDNAAQYGGTTREMSAKSYYHILCTGIDGTAIPAGTLIASDTNPQTNLMLPADAEISRAAFNQAAVVMASPDTSTALGVALNGTLYTIQPDTGKSAAENLTTKTIGSVVTFATAEDGDIMLPNGIATKIVKSVPGMVSVVNVGEYVAGRFKETDMEFRKSYVDKIYHRSSSMLESIKSAILENVQGVLSVAPYENDTNVVDEMGRWPHSVEVVVDGGDTVEIAQQILNTRAGGISTFGSVETVLHGVYGEEIVIRFNRPTYVHVWFRVGVTLSRNINPPANYVELIKGQILEKVEALKAGESVIPQKFRLFLSGIDYMDIWLSASSEEGEMPAEYDQRSIIISARERAVTDESRIEVFIDG